MMTTAVCNITWVLLLMHITWMELGGGGRVVVVVELPSLQDEPTEWWQTLEWCLPRQQEHLVVERQFRLV